MDSKFLAIWILRISMAVTFVWIGVLIMQQPEAWGNYLLPWARDVSPIPIKELMLGTGAIDIVLGIAFLITPIVAIAGLVTALHIIVVLIASGINAITLRDIAILGAALFFFFYYKK